MSAKQDIFTYRESLDKICKIPEKIISVYTLEQHVWAGGHLDPDAFRQRKPELKTIQEFQIDPVRHFLNDIFRKMAAPYRSDRVGDPIGHGYWIQAEFGSGKSHLLCFLASLALGSKDSWDLVREKEQKAGRGKRESLYQFWEEGLEAKSSAPNRGIFVVVKTLVGSGGRSADGVGSGRRLLDYILDEAKEQLLRESGKNISLYPVELLADRFISDDLDRYRNDLKKFLRDPRFFEEDEFEEIDEFIREIQDDKSPAYKESCGNKLWRFYDEYLKVRPRIEADLEEILEHMAKAIMAEGYSGILLLLDEVSLFMKDRDETQRTEDEKTLLVLSNRLTRVHNLPIWTVCAAQQAIESKMGAKNIIAEDRLKLIPLLKDEKDYYDIVLSRVRDIIKPDAITSYYSYYKRGFTWSNAISEDEFGRFFPFHKPAIEVLRAITYELTTTRSAIHFMHQTLKYQMKIQGTELIRLWDFFDEALTYEEDPSGTYAGIKALRASKDTEYRIYEICKKQIDSITKGTLKVYRDRSIKTLQTLFLYYVSKTRQQGLTPEEIANSVLTERSPDATVDENIQHYETIADSLGKELPQIAANYDEDNRPRFRFDPIITSKNPKREFEKARAESESNLLMQQEAWNHLLALDEWPVRTRQMTIYLENGVRSIFRDIAAFVGPWEERSMAKAGPQNLSVNWQNRQIAGRIEMLDLGRVVSDSLILPAIASPDSDLDFAVFVGTKPLDQSILNKILLQRNDPRLIVWTPEELTAEERDRLLDFAAYRKLVADSQGKDSEDAIAIINWVAEQLQREMARIKKIVDSSYDRGRMDALNNTRMDFHVAGDLPGILPPIVDRVLRAAYDSRDIEFEGNLVFTKEYGVNVINGIVKTGQIPKGAKQDKNISAALNFGPGLKIVRRGAERVLDTSANSHVSDILSFIESKSGEGGQAIKIDTLMKNFMGVGGPKGKNYGLSRRMVQIYLLCLVQQGKIRIALGPKSGISSNYIDYSNISNIDFTARVLDSMLELQRLAKPKDWEVLRPYAEKLLGHELKNTNDDAIISGYRKELIETFEKERDQSSEVLAKAKELFSLLAANNPYEKEVEQAAAFFANDLRGGKDIEAVLYALDQAFGYRVFQQTSPDQREIDDLANRLDNYRKIKRFLEFDRELETAQIYCSYVLPDQQELSSLKEMQKALSLKLNNLQPYIDSEVKLSSELIGKNPPQAGESGTLWSFIHEYTVKYATMHDNVMVRIEENRRMIREILQSNEMKALGVLEKIKAIQQNDSVEIKARLQKLSEEIFSCPEQSRSSIDKDLRVKPEHGCGLSFGSASKHLDFASQKSEEAQRIFDDTINMKMEFFLSPGIKERLRQGENEPEIAALLKCQSPSEVRSYLTESSLQDPTLVDKINKYLLKVLVKSVRISDFKPITRTIERNQIDGLVSAFKKFLEEQFEDDDPDSRQMLQLE